MARFAREEFVDFAERRKYAELAATFRGLVPEAKGSTVQVGVAVIISGAQRPRSNAELELEVVVAVAEFTSLVSRKYANKVERSSTGSSRR